MSVLLQRPKPYPDENLRSYVIRLVEANGYYDDKSIYKLMGLISLGGTPRNIYKLNREEVETYLTQLCKLSDNSIASIYKLTYLSDLTDERTDVFTKAGDATRLLHYATMQVCTICLDENPYYRKVWDVHYYTCCHIHKCLMISKCPSCDSQLKPNGTCIYKCRCGYDLRTSVNKFIPEQELSVSLRINSLVSNHISNELEEKFIDQLNLISYLYMTKIFARQVSKYYFNARLSEIDDTEKLHEIIQKVNSIFAIWPTSFFAFLDEFIKIPKRKEKMVGVSNDFGRFHQSLYRYFSHEVFQEILTQFNQYFFNHWDGGHINKVIRSIKNKVITEPLYISMSEVEQTTKLDHRLIKKLIQMGTIEGKIRKRNEKEHVTVNRLSLKQYIDNRKSYLNLKEAAIILGINLTRMRQLINNNFFEISTGYKIDQNKTWVIPIKALYDILDYFDKSLVNKDPELASVSFNEAIRAFDKNRLDLFILKVKQGKIKPIHKEEKIDGLAAYRFNKTEVVDVAVKIPVNYLTISKCAEKLFIAEDGVRRLIKSEMLEFEINKNQIIVSDVILAGFMRNYITMGEIQTRLNNYKAAAVNTYLMTELITPVYKNSIRIKPLIYFRRDVEKKLNSPKNNLLPREVADSLNVAVESVKKWIQKGWIKSTVIAGYNVVKNDEIELFKNTYIGLFEISEKTGLTKPQVLYVLKKNTLYPIKNDGNDDAKPFLFLRSEISKVFKI